jgi:pimeloyl-ACP methyl ester carboxylesterase
MSRAGGTPVIPGGEASLLAILRVGVRAKWLLNPLSRTILGARGMSRALHRAGVFARDNDLLEEVLAEFSQVDWGRYFTMTRHLHDHSAAAYLADVRVPTLITAGTRDILTPPEVAERLHRAIRGSELYVVPEATHYIVAEFPEVLTDRIARFLEKVTA